MDYERLVGHSRTFNALYVAVHVFSVLLAGKLISDFLGLARLIGALGLIMNERTERGTLRTPADFAAFSREALEQWHALRSTFADSIGLASFVLLAVVLLGLLIWLFRARPKRVKRIPESQVAAVKQHLPPGLAGHEMWVSYENSIDRRRFYLDKNAFGLLIKAKGTGKSPGNPALFRFVAAHEWFHHRCLDHLVFTTTVPAAFAAAVAPALMVTFLALFGLVFAMPPAVVALVGSAGSAIISLLLALVIGYFTYRLLRLERDAFVHVKEWFADRAARASGGEPPYEPRRPTSSGLGDLWRQQPTGSERLAFLESGSERAPLFLLALIIKWGLLRLTALVAAGHPVDLYVMLVAIDMVFLGAIVLMMRELRPAWPERVGAIAGRGALALTLAVLAASPLLMAAAWLVATPQVPLTVPAIAWVVIALVALPWIAMVTACWIGAKLPSPSPMVAPVYGSIAPTARGASANRLRTSFSPTRWLAALGALVGAITMAIALLIVARGVYTEIMYAIAIAPRPAPWVVWSDRATMAVSVGVVALAASNLFVPSRFRLVAEGMAVWLFSMLLVIAATIVAILIGEDPGIFQKGEDAAAKRIQEIIAEHETRHIMMLAVAASLMTGITGLLYSARIRSLGE